MYFSTLQNDTVTPGNRIWKFLLKLNMQLVFNQATELLALIPEKWNSQKHYISVPSSFIHNKQKVEISQML